MTMSRGLRSHRLLLLALGGAVAAAFFIYPIALDIPLLDPDEGLHASVAQEMAEGGDWVVPRFLGTPFLDKPILYFWAEAFSLRVFGMHQAAVRLPGLVFGLLGVATTGLVGWRMFGRTTGLLGGLFYATMILPTALAQAAAHDVALIPWVSGALLLFWESHRAATRRRAAAYTAGIGLLLGLSLLTKGLTGIAVVGIAYGAYLLVTGQLTFAACGRGAAALMIAAAVAAPWYAAVELRNPSYLRYWFVERHVLGYISSKQSHGGEPWWYYLPIVLGGGLPWIAYLPVAMQDGWVRWRAASGRAAERVGDGSFRPDRATVLLWCWLIGGTLFFSVAHSKLVTYVWPIFPAAALLAAVAWARLLKGTLSQAARRTLAGTVILSCALGPVLLPVAMIVAQQKYQLLFSGTTWAAAILAALTSCLPAGFWLAGLARLTLSSAALSLAVQFLFVMTTLVPGVAATTSGRELAGHFNRLGHLPHRLLFADERIGSFVFYLTPELRAGLRDGQLQQVHLGDLRGDVRDAVIAIPLRRANGARHCAQLAGRPFHRVGHYQLYEQGEPQGNCSLEYLCPNMVGLVWAKGEREE